ncbi:PREDICTED: FERM, RhoGEF and pleckstrin domain-containing protein 1-like [Phaethon lepturus]|uniref:FERM, RhoGEF and pleckstrin domain-containing protein 1-like n=1 Tax=Phaethon lepturus TaxID=97097 RepID=UPI0005307F2D|nr:PREDICTED: FERM, RhoGEF and pleckstrin domain-containing protein 1-like [Phaethon lepturus]
MGETEQRPTAGSRLGAQENAGISTLEHGQKPPMTPPGKLVSIKIQMLDDTQETFDVPMDLDKLKANGNLMKFSKGKVLPLGGITLHTGTNWGRID